MYRKIGNDLPPTLFLTYVIGEQSIMWRNHSREHQSKAGKAGYQATLTKHGFGFAAKKAADWRRDNPSNLEKIVIGWLNELDVNYSRETAIDRFYVDFLIGDLAIEVNGEIWHTDNEVAGNRVEHDAGKYKTIADLGYTVLVLPEKSVLSGEAKKTLENILQ